MKNPKIPYLVFFAICLFACQERNNRPRPDTEAVVNTEVSQVVSLATVATPTESLGKLLFYDPILSGNKDVACATCHHPSLGYADGVDLSLGVNAAGLGRNRHFLSSTNASFAKRNSMTILNAIFNGQTSATVPNQAAAPMFWDSRVRSLELQALEPIKSNIEMRGTAYPEALALDSVVARLKNIPEYRLLFSNVFGTGETINATNIGKAIVSFERSLTAMNSPYDRYKNGETTAMTPLQVRGMNAFQTVGCAACHSGPMFSDYQLHVLSVPDNAKSTVSDNGNVAYAFRTQSLRNVSLTAPFMHSGVFQSLDDVLRFYGRIAGGNSQNPNLNIRQVDPKIRDVRIQNNRDAIVAFINALADNNFDKSVPTAVPSKLNVGGNIR
jgi:cytochrome c peroxidase